MRFTETQGTAPLSYTLWTTDTTSAPRGEEPPDTAVPARV